MPQDLNSYLRTKDFLTTVIDNSVLANALQIVIAAPGATRRIVIVGMLLANTTGAGAAEVWSVTGAALMMTTDFAITTDKEFTIPMAADALNQALTIDVSATALTTGSLTVTYRIQEEA